jgi:hypothetical protein
VYFAKTHEQFNRRAAITSVERVEVLNQRIIREPINRDVVHGRDSAGAGQPGALHLLYITAFRDALRAPLGASGEAS